MNDEVKNTEQLQEQCLDKFIVSADSKKALNGKEYACPVCNKGYTIVQDGSDKIHMTFRCPHCNAVIGMEISNHIFHIFKIIPQKNGGKQLQLYDSWKMKQVTGYDIEKYEADMLKIQKIKEESHRLQVEEDKKKIEADRKERAEHPIECLIRDAVVELLKSGNITLSRKSIKEASSKIVKEVKSKADVELSKQDVEVLLNSLIEAAEKFISAKKE